MSSLTNSEDQDEMPQNAAFHQGLLNWLRKNNHHKHKYIIIGNADL